MVVKLARTTLAKSPFQTPISAAHSIRLLRRRRTQRSNREGDPAINGAISDGVRDLDILKFSPRKTSNTLNQRSEVRGQRSENGQRRSQNIGNTFGSEHR